VDLFSQAIFFPGDFLILSNSRAFPRPGIYYFPGFSGHVGTL